MAVPGDAPRARGAFCAFRLPSLRLKEPDSARKSFSTGLPATIGDAGDGRPRAKRGPRPELYCLRIVKLTSFEATVPAMPSAAAAPAAAVARSIPRVYIFFSLAQIFQNDKN
jgi:hypothetical protein